MALNSLFCADVPLQNYSHSLVEKIKLPTISLITEYLQAVNGM